MANLAGKQAWARIRQAFDKGNEPKASDFIIWAKSQQGWQFTQSFQSPLKCTDKNAVIRLTLKEGSPRTSGSNHPHVELRNAKGHRIDLMGNRVTRRSVANHTQIDWDI